VVGGAVEVERGRLGQGSGSPRRREVRRVEETLPGGDQQAATPSNHDQSLHPRPSGPGDEPLGTPHEHLLVVVHAVLRADRGDVRILGVRVLSPLDRIGGVSAPDGEVDAVDVPAAAGRGRPPMDAYDQLTGYGAAD